MKHFYQIASIFFLLLSFSINVYSQEFIIEGIKYKLSEGEAQVVKILKSGAVTFPATIRYNNKEYSVTSISSYSYKNGYEITKITIPSSIKSIGEGAFYYCQSLQELVISDSEKELELGTSICSIKKLYLGRNLSGNTNLHQVDYKNVFGDKITDVIIGENVTEILGYLFYGCSSITKIELPKGLKSIHTCAFSGCKGLKSIKLPHQLEFIGSSAFINTDLTEISIPNSVTTIGDRVFENCTKLKKIIIEDGNYNLKFSGGMFYFAEGLNLENVYVGRNLSSVVFKSCKIETLTIGANVSEVGGSFFQCDGIKNVIINDSKQSLRLDDFMPKRGTEKVYMGRDIINKTIDAYVFGIDVKEAEIGSDVLSICRSAFKDCQKLEKVTIPEGVREILDYAFYGCTSLETIHLPKTITNFGYMCFFECKRLKEIYEYAEEHPSCKPVVFDDYACNNVTLYIPKGALESYKEFYNNPFYSFKKKIEMSGTSINTLSISENNVSWYSLNGTNLDKPKGKGVFLLRKNGKVQKVILKNH